LPWSKVTTNARGQQLETARGMRRNCKRGVPALRPIFAGLAAAASSLSHYSAAAPRGHRLALSFRLVCLRAGVLLGRLSKSPDSKQSQPVLAPCCMHTYLVFPNRPSLLRFLPLPRPLKLPILVLHCQRALREQLPQKLELFFLRHSQFLHVHEGSLSCRQGVHRQASACACS
jgi:hypothetical protein